MSIPELNMQLARVLGLDTSRLKAFTLRVEANQIPVIQAVYLVYEPAHVKPAELTKHFSLVPRNER